MSTAMEIVGFVCLVIAAALTSVPLACAVAGLSLIFLAQGLDGVRVTRRKNRGGQNR